MEMTHGFATAVNAINASGACEMRDTCYRAATCTLTTCATLQHAKTIDAREAGEDVPTPKPKPRKNPVKRSFKRCSKCHEMKPITEFHRNAKSRDGYICTCKDCRHAYSVAQWAEARARREARGEKVRRTEARRNG